jgi:hypothetical protein
MWWILFWTFKLVTVLSSSLRYEVIWELVGNKLLGRCHSFGKYRDGHKDIYTHIYIYIYLRHSFI